MTMASIGFIGLGNMGGPMAANLVKAGHTVPGFDLVEAARSRGGGGASDRGLAAEAVEGAEVVITMLPAGKHVLEVYQARLLAAAPAGALFIDCSTIDVGRARSRCAGGCGWASGARCAGVRGDRRRQGRDADLHGAAATTEALAAAAPVLEAMGKRVVHCGEPRRGPGGEDLQQHDPRHLDDRRQRGLRAGREAGSQSSGALRRGLDLLGPVLVADHLLPGARPGADEPGQQRLQAGFRRGPDAQGSRACLQAAAEAGANARSAPWPHLIYNHLPTGNGAAWTSPPSSTSIRGCFDDRDYNQPSRDGPHPPITLNRPKALNALNAAADGRGRRAAARR